MTGWRRTRRFPAFPRASGSEIRLCSFAATRRVTFKMDPAAVGKEGDPGVRAVRRETNSILRDACLTGMSSKPCGRQARSCDSQVRTAVYSLARTDYSPPGLTEK